MVLRFIDKVFIEEGQRKELGWCYIVYGVQVYSYALCKEGRKEGRRELRKMVSFRGCDL